ncbi:MAG: MarR family transcriptional regulator [Kordiimonadaceae bacterium]|nr:MarR family transcriptional regulator [Kordiimonadaceae bacterium]
MKYAKIDGGPCQKTKLMSRMIGNSFRLTQELDRRMKHAFSLSLAQYEVLLAIDCAEGGQITMSNLSRKLNVSNANMTGMTSRLQTSGLLEKKSLPTDRRIYSVALTDEGKSRLSDAVEKHNIWIKELMSFAEGEEVELMNSFLEKMENQAGFVFEE